MRTLTRRLAPRARTAWLALSAATVLAVAVVLAVVLTNGGGRGAIVSTVFTGVVAFGLLAAFLDAILVPGNPDVRRQAGHTAGWSGALGGGGWDGGGHGGGHGGSGDGGSCG